MNTTPRLDFKAAAPGAIRVMYALETYLAGCGLEKSLLGLVALLASQINGCAFCIDMHWRDCRGAGEDERRLYLLDAWRESPGYTDRERAALAWTEAVTLVAVGRVPDGVFAAVRPHYTDKELTDLTLAVAAINAWNRLEISFRAVPGSFHVLPDTAEETG